MITDINESTLASIQNPALRAYAAKYVDIYEDFRRQVREMGMEFAEEQHGESIQPQVRELGRKGAVVRNDGKSVYSNRISPSCVACQTAIASHTFFISLKCHRDCFFCFNPNQENYKQYREQVRDLAAELDALHASGQRVQHLALTGGEPLLHKDAAVQFFQRARRHFPGSYTRLYTCGDHLDPETLQSLRDAGMNEIRFSIRLEDTEKAQARTYQQIALAREYIPNVMVEMPVLPGSFAAMQQVLLKLDELGAFGINLLELCFPFHNAEEFRKRGYRIKPRPFRVLYNYWYAGGLPVAGSEETCLDLLEFALVQKLRLGVHYCSLENKHTGQVYQQNALARQGKPLYFSQRDYFLKSAKVFGEDVVTARNVLDKQGVRAYAVNPEYQGLEFPVNRIKLLRNAVAEVGISSHVLEDRGGETVLRELKVDVTSPEAFKLSDI
ncbi:MAG TPA: radical SAM protein [Anaerolineales bacterium]|nr:radical SAM protein [Anaerolineales bacterium]